MRITSHLPPPTSPPGWPSAGTRWRPSRRWAPGGEAGSGLRSPLRPGCPPRRQRTRRYRRWLLPLPSPPGPEERPRLPLRGNGARPGGEGEEKETGGRAGALLPPARGFVLRPCPRSELAPQRTAGQGRRPPPAPLLSARGQGSPSPRFSLILAPEGPRASRFRPPVLPPTWGGTWTLQLPPLCPLQRHLSRLGCASCRVGLGPWRCGRLECPFPRVCVCVCVLAQVGFNLLSRHRTRKLKHPSPPPPGIWFKVAFPRELHLQGREVMPALPGAARTRRRGFGRPSVRGSPGRRWFAASWAAGTWCEPLLSGEESCSVFFL